MKMKYTSVVSLVLATGCGWTVPSAREAYAQKWCSHYVQCGNIGSGSGKDYATTDDCLTRYRSLALDLWPTADCDSKIDAQGLDMCLKAVENTKCNDLVDWAATNLKCTKADVCR
jgi:hypothetical protein